MRFVLVLVLLAGWRSQALIQQPLQRDEAPAIDLVAALGSARAYAAQHHVTLAGRYLQGAVFDATARHWVFDWQAPGTPIHLTVITVDESGAIAASGDYSTK